MDLRAPMQENDWPMAYVITQPCEGVKDGACVEACPMDCIGTDDSHNQMFINPAECIDCGACESACPVAAPFLDVAVPDKWRHYIELNAAFFG